MGAAAGVLGLGGRGCKLNAMALFRFNTSCTRSDAVDVRCGHGAAAGGTAGGVSATGGAVGGLGVGAGGKVGGVSTSTGKYSAP